METFPGKEDDWVKKGKWASASKVVEGLGFEPSVWQDISPHDIIQGSLGDCWFVSAISGICTRPELIEACFPGCNGELSEDNQYTVRLYDLDGIYGECLEPVDITVNDHIPVRPYYSNNPAKLAPALATPTEGEIYVVLLEKAFAKMYEGKFTSLQGGWTFLGYTYLCGCPVHLDIVVEADKMELKTVDVMAGQVGRTHCNPEEQGPTTSDEAWAYVMDGFFKYGALLSCTWDGVGLEAVAETGLVFHPAYTVTRVIETSDGHRLLQCRNPWGNKKEWGMNDPDFCKWCDHSPLWEEFPDAAEECGFTGPRADGLFWMSWEMFIDHGKSLVVSYLPGRIPDEFEVS
jgi:hypothetical protein